MQAWTRRINDETNKEMSELRKEMNEKLEEMMREVKNSKRTESVPNKKNCEQTTARKETPNHIDVEDGE